MPDTFILSVTQSIILSKGVILTRPTCRFKGNVLNLFNWSVVVNFQHGQNFYPSAVYPPPPPPPPPMQQQPGGMMPPAGEVCQISVPNAAVGAIIGAGGSNIKQMMRESGAFVNVSLWPSCKH